MFQDWKMVGSIPVMEKAADLGKLVAASNERRTHVDPIYAPVPAPEEREGDSYVQVHPGVAATVSTYIHAPDSIPAYWGARIQHLIGIFPSPGATAEQIRYTLDEATLVAKTHDHRTCLQLAANGEDVPGHNDRSIITRTAFLDLDLTRALFQSGFQIMSMAACQSLDKLREVAGAKTADPSSRISGKITIRGPREDDKETIAAALTALNEFDRDFMIPHPKRASEDDTSRGYARTAIAAGAGWTALADHGDEDGHALLAMYPPQDSTWAADGLHLGTTSYLGLAYTPPTWRGQGAMNHMIAGALEHASGNGVEHVVVEYAHHNPLSSRYWVAWGFRPVVATWMKRVAG